MDFPCAGADPCKLPAGDYRFTATVDDGVRLLIGNRTLIDAWQVQTVTEHSQIIYLGRQCRHRADGVLRSNGAGGSALDLDQAGDNTDGNTVVRVHASLDYNTASHVYAGANLDRSNIANANIHGGANANADLDAGLLCGRRCTGTTPL